MQVDVAALSALADSSSGQPLQPSAVSAQAQFHLGYMQQWGKGSATKDVPAAVQWYRASAGQFCLPYGTSMYTLAEWGSFFLRGCFTRGVVNGGRVRVCFFYVRAF
jgi:hypothetical protein